MNPYICAVGINRLVNGVMQMLTVLTSEEDTSVMFGVHSAGDTHEKMLFNV